MDFPTLWVIFQIGFSCCVGIFLLLFVRRREGAGPVLLDLSSSLPGSSIIKYLNVATFALLIVTVVINIVPSQLKLGDIARMLFYASLFAVSVFRTSSGTQIREQGVLVNGDLLRWE